MPQPISVQLTQKGIFTGLSTDVTDKDKIIYKHRGSLFPNKLILAKSGSGMSFIEKLDLINKDKV